MEKDTFNIDFNNTLLLVVNKMFNKEIESLNHDFQDLHGGTLGDVKLIYGKAIIKSGESFDYKVVYKRQKKWERYFDKDSWRREYDLYKSDLGEEFLSDFRWPTIYHMQLLEDEVHIWMEYIDGYIGESLTIEMCEEAAKAIGRFQGKLYAEKPEVLNTIKNLSNLEFLKRNYLHYRSWPEVYDYIRSDQCDLPKHLRNLIIEIDQSEEKVWNEINKLPVVFSQRDYWNTNIFYRDNGIICIDWDTAGWGRLGEDISSLVADVEEPSLIVESFVRCVPAYLNGFSEFYDVSHISKKPFYYLIIIMFGYRFIENYKFAKTDQDKKLYLEILERLYSIRMSFAN